MEIPSLVGSRLGDEDIETAVSLGDEDVVCFTQSRTLLYRGEGLLSDEGVEVFSHDVETLEISEGRRKTKFVLEYVDGTESFTIPGRRSEAVLERLLDGVLTTAGVIEAAESIAGVFEFSELTLALTDARLLKHVGTPVWDADFEEYPYADVTGLSFEEGSVATQVVLAVDGRPERIKAPNDDAPMVREALEKALFAYHDVSSLEELNAAVGEDEAEDDENDQSGGDDIGLSDGISPLVGEGSDAGLDAEAGTDTGADAGTDGGGGSAAGAGGRSGAGRDAGGGRDAGEPQARSEEPTAAATDPSQTASEGTRTTRSSPDSADGTVTPTPDSQAESATGSDTGPEPSPAADAAVDPAEFEELKAQVDRLTQAVKRQNEILERYQETVDRQRQAVKRQGETVEQLIEELRQGR